MKSQHVVNPGGYTESNTALLYLTLGRDNTTVAIKLEMHVHVRT